MSTVRTVATDINGPAKPCHMWPLGSPLTDATRCTVCRITWAEHYARSACEKAARCAHCGEVTAEVGMYSDPFGSGGLICGACSDHLEVSEWRKDDLLRHVFTHDPSFYFTSSITKKELAEWHLDRHRTHPRRSTSHG